MLLCGGFILLSPIPKQVLGIETPYLREWAMLKLDGKDICDLRFVKRTAGGPDELLDRLALLGYGYRYHVPPAARRVTSMEAALEQGRAICAALPSGSDVRLLARCGSVDGWIRRSAGERNICAANPIGEE